MKQHILNSMLQSVSHLIHSVEKSDDAVTFQTNNGDTMRLSLETIETKPKPTTYNWSCSWRRGTGQDRDVCELKGEGFDTIEDAIWDAKLKHNFPYHEGSLCFNKTTPTGRIRPLNKRERATFQKLASKLIRP